MKKTNKNSFGVIAILSLVIAAVCSLTSCSDDLDVQQSYPFTVEVMPYADKIAKGQTIELRFEIKPEGNYANTLYTIRYFQYDGEGSLKLVDGPVLVIFINPFSTQARSPFTFHDTSFILFHSSVFPAASQVIRLYSFFKYFLYLPASSSSNAAFI